MRPWSAAFGPVLVLAIVLHATGARAQGEGDPSQPNDAGTTEPSAGEPSAGEPSAGEPGVAEPSAAEPADGEGDADASAEPDAAAPDASESDADAEAAAEAALDDWEPPPPLPGPPLASVIGGVGVGVGLLVGTAGLVTGILAESSYDRYERDRSDTRESLRAEGEALEAASIASWVTGGAFALAGLTTLIVVGVQRREAREAESRENEGEGDGAADAAVELGASLGRVFVRGRF